MAKVCRFWNYRPCDYWALTYAEHSVLTAWMDGENKERKRQIDKNKPKRRK